MMVKKVAIILAILMTAFLGWALLGTSEVSVTINGHEIKGLLGAAVGIWGVILAAIIIFCIAMLLVFVFAGIGLIVLGCFALAGIIFIAIVLPFLLPLVIPLFIVWVFCSLSIGLK